MKVRIKKLTPNAVIPVKKYNSDFCYDLTATSVEEIKPGVYCYGTGLAVEMVRDIDETLNKRISIDIRPRSSIYKTGMVLANSTGTIDEGYRDEIKLIFYKVADGDIYEVGERIAQMKIGFTVPVEFEEVEELNPAVERNLGGFGHTGRK